jgi:hypothetical protein
MAAAGILGRKLPDFPLIGGNSAPAGASRAEPQKNPGGRKRGIQLCISGVANGNQVIPVFPEYLVQPHKEQRSCFLVEIFSQSPP